MNLIDDEEAKEERAQAEPGMLRRAGSWVWGVAKAWLFCSN